MTATLDDEVADLRRANADLQQRLDAALAERDEGLEQQTAAAEVLEVINSSPGDLAPVFDAILEKAHTLCGVEQGVLVTYEGEYFRAVADHNMPQPLVELLRRPFRASPGSIQDRLVRGERLIHIPDQAALGSLGTGTPIGRASLEAGIRTVLLVPLRKDGNLIGYISAYLSATTS